MAKQIIRCYEDHYTTDPDNCCRQILNSTAEAQLEADAPGEIVAMASPRPGVLVVVLQGEK